MARNFPLDTMMQKALEERYETETKTQLAWYINKGLIGQKPHGKENAEPATEMEENKHKDESMAKIISNLERKIETINNERGETDKKEPEKISGGLVRRVGDMRPSSSKTKILLYSGISKEGKGRSLYLSERKKKGPEEKYDQPILASMDYGWKLKETPAAEFTKPRFGRTKLVEDTFYTRTGIPIMHETGKKSESLWDEQ